MKKYYIAALLGLLLGPSCFVSAAIVRESHLDYAAHSGDVTYDCAASGTGLGLVVAIYSGSNATLSVTFNSVPMTQLAQFSNSGTSEYSTLFGLLGAATGSHTIAITGSHAYVGVACYSGVDTTAILPRVHNTMTTTGTSISTSVTTTDTHSALIGFGAYDGSSGNMGAGAGTVLVDTANLGLGLDLFESSNLNLTSGVNTLVVTGTAEAAGLGLGVASLPALEATPTTTPTSTPPSTLYTGPTYNDWLLVCMVVLFILSLIMWRIVFYPFKVKA